LAVSGKVVHYHWFIYNLVVATLGTVAIWLQPEDSPLMLSIGLGAAVGRSMLGLLMSFCDL
jgi:hypothetical protein